VGRSSSLPATWSPTGTIDRRSNVSRVATLPTPPKFWMVELAPHFATAWFAPAAIREKPN
jgi:hypothetical protein